MGLIASLSVLPANAAEKPQAILLIESSDAMSEQLSGVRAFIAMGNALAANFVTYDGTLELGFMTMGQGGCTNPDVRLERQALQAAPFAKAITTMRPQGEPALSTAIRAAAGSFTSPPAGPRSLIVIGSGNDSCSDTPCAVADELARDFPLLRVHAIAFPSGGAKNPNLSCIAKATRGIYRAAGTQDELAAALNVVFENAVATPEPAAPAAAWGSATVQPGDTANGNWDIAAIPVPPPDAAAPARESQKPPGTPVNLRAILSDGGPNIPSGIIWRVFDAAAADAASMQLVATERNAAPTIALPPGDYMVNAAYGRAYLTRRITIEPGATEPVDMEFVLNAGGLRVNAVTESGAAISDRKLVCDIYADERNQFGERELIMSGVNAGLIVRLNAGLYHVVSRLGDANATVAADVSVEAGKLTDITLTHDGSRITFKLVQAPGGEAFADTHWRIADAKGDVIKETVGALPTHVLAPGKYRVTAVRGSQAFSKEFTVAPGTVGEVEVIAQ